MPLLLAATTLAAATALTPPAAASHGWVVLTCTVTIPRYPGPGSGPCRMTGTLHGTVYSSAPTTIVFTTTNTPAITCPLAATGAGYVAGIDFVYSRVAGVALVTTSGALVGSGVAAFRTVSPVGNPCGASNAVEDLLMTLAG